MSNMKKVVINYIDEPFEDNNIYNLSNYPKDGLYMINLDTHSEIILRENNVCCGLNVGVLLMMELGNQVAERCKEIAPKKELLGPLQGPYFMGNEKSEGIPIHIHEKALDIIMKMAGKE